MNAGLLDLAAIFFDSAMLFTQLSGALNDSDFVLGGPALAIMPSLYSFFPLPTATDSTDIQGPRDAPGCLEPFLSGPSRHLSQAGHWALGLALRELADAGTVIQGLAPWQPQFILKSES